MSDLQEIITNTSIKAFNTGLWRGQELERERIIELLNELAVELNIKLEQEPSDMTQHAIWTIYQTIQRIEEDKSE